MKAIQVQTFGGPEELQICELDIPKPGNEEVLVQVEAVGVNPVDAYIRAGNYPVLPQPPFIPGKDVGGRVVEVGTAVKKWKEGDRVYSAGTRTGGYAEFSVCHQSQIFSLPQNVDCKMGAAGLEVHGTAGTEEGLVKIRRVGAHKAYNHSAANYLDEMTFSDDAGYDIILEMLANVNLVNDLALLGRGGRVVIIGSRGEITIDPRATMAKETEILGMSLFNSTEEEMKEAQVGLYQQMNMSRLTPQIALELPLEEAPEAHRRILEGGNCGKILLIPGMKA
ncbi:MAG: NADPH:quinone reductase [Desulfopila sp.]